MLSFFVSKYGLNGGIKMNFVTTIGYHDAGFEVEIIVCKTTRSKSEAEKIGNSSTLNRAILHTDKIVIGKGNHSIIINKADKDLYQFKVCRDTEETKNKILSDEDYERISWDQAIKYFNEEYKNFSLPYSLESHYYGVYENEAILT